MHRGLASGQRGMAEGAEVVVCDILLMCTVFAHTAQPELILRDASASHNARRQLALRTRRKREKKKKNMSNQLAQLFSPCSLCELQNRSGRILFKAFNA